MDDRADVRLGITRELSLDDWGRAILEEVLFKSAKQVSAQGGEPDVVSVRLDFEVTADRESGCLVITTPGEIEQAIATCLPLRLTGAISLTTRRS